MNFECRFAPDAASVPAVRRFVLDCVGALPGELGDTVRVIVSEIATNAVLHARTEFDVSVVLSESSLRVEMTDGGGGHLQVHDLPPASALHGRGLLLVDQLADDWGVVESPDRAEKTVWFRISLQGQSERDTSTKGRVSSR